jgi:acetyl-CoA acyltransferase
MSKSSVIVEYLRSPFTLAHKGALSKVRPDEMAGQVIKSLIEKSGVTPDHVEDLQMGCAFPEGEQGFNIAKISAFAAGLPDTVAAATVNRFCGSSMEGIHAAAGKIALGAGDVFICAGVESMTRVPMGGFNPLPHPNLYQQRPDVYISMGLTAENVAQEYNISRREQEEFAVASQQKAATAQSCGKLKDEIVTIIDGNNRVDEDGCIRPETSLDGLADLKTAFLAGGSVTAGTSSPLTDGVSAVVVTSENYADQHGLKKLAWIKSIAVSGCKPETMGLGPIFSTRKAVERAGLSCADIDLFEINEAFSSQALASIRDLNIDHARVNLDGGALALGHPLGATGARITGKAAQLLSREGAKYAVATQCIGGGQGIATVLEAI